MFFKRLASFLSTVETHQVNKKSFHKDSMINFLKENLLLEEEFWLVLVTYID